MSFSRHPVALGLLFFYGRRSTAGNRIAEAAVLCLYRERTRAGVPDLDIAGLEEDWSREVVSPVYFDTETGSVLTSLPGSEDAFADLRFLVLDEPTQRRALFGATVATLFSSPAGR